MSSVIEQGDKRIIANHNVHSIYLYQRIESMRRFYDRAYAIQIDSMPLIFLGRLLGMHVSRENRLTYLDWGSQLLTDAVRNGWRIYLGSKPGVAEVIRERFGAIRFLDCRLLPHMVILTSRCEAPRISRCSPRLPHIVPTSCSLAWACRGRNNGLSITSTRYKRILFSTLARRSTTKPASRILHLAGLALGVEWIYRLFREPGRLARRYLVEPWMIVLWILRDLMLRVSTRRLRKDRG